MVLVLVSDLVLVLVLVPVVVSNQGLSTLLSMALAVLAKLRLDHDLMNHCRQLAPVIVYVYVCAGTCILTVWIQRPLGASNHLEPPSFD